MSPARLSKWPSTSAPRRLGVEKLSKMDLQAARLWGYQINFMTFAAVYAIAVFCWWRIDATEPVAPDEAPH